MSIASRISVWADGESPAPPAYWGLYFEAEEDGVTVTANANGRSGVKITIESSLDGENWTEFAYVNGYTKRVASVALANTGDRVYFRAGTGGNTTMAYLHGGTRYGVFFSVAGRCGAHGNIMSLLDADNIDNTTITGTNCFQRLFFSCTSLTAAPELPATTLAANCYDSMFYNCTSLTAAPELPATKLEPYCYKDMFYSCPSLSKAPALPATALADHCYYDMFAACRSLTTAPELPATTMAADCYNSMFKWCSSLTSAPVLPATTTTTNSYRDMFYGCTLLASINVAFTSWDPSSQYDFDNWVYGVAASGTFYCPAALGDNSTIDRGSSKCPNGWTVVNI